MAKIKLIVRYNGYAYQGWQRQPHTEQTIQHQLEKGLSRVLDHEVQCFASGRTDSGAHSLGQVVHFETDRDVSNYLWPYAFNRNLPEDIKIRRAWVAPDEFHALHSAANKTYKYVIQFGGPSAFNSHMVWNLRNKLDIDLLNDYSQRLIGEHDFKSFQTSGTEVATTVRTITQAKWLKFNKNRIVLTITGSGFLKQMIRNIVGTQVDLATKSRDVDNFVEILNSIDRCSALGTAPAAGLYLFRVRYPQFLDNKCRRL